MDQGTLFPHERAHMLDDEKRLQALSEEKLVELLALKGDEDIADLGSGTGFYTDRLASHTTGTVYAIEIQAEMRAAHRRRSVPANVEQVAGDIDDLPCAGGTLDRALSIYTFHEAHDRAGVAKLGRALRPGGRLVIVDWRRNPEGSEHGPPFAVRFTKEEVAELLAPLFQVESTEDLDRFLFAVVAIKTGAGEATHGL